MIDVDTQPDGTYWHFLAEGGCLRYGDNRRVVPGETLRVNERPILRERGLHASLRVIDALVIAPGPIVCLVTLGGKVIHETAHTIPDKSVGQERTALWVYDASVLLRRYACSVAYDVLLAERRAEREPDPRSFAVIETVQQVLDGFKTRAEWDAAKIAAEDAGRGTPLGAAKDAALRAAWCATWIAADSPTWCAAWTETDSANNARLTNMLLGAMKQGDGRFAPSSADGFVLTSVGA